MLAQTAASQPSGEPTMPSIHPGQIELERLMEAARDARSAALYARCIALFAGLRRLVRMPTVTRPVHSA